MILRCPNCATRYLVANEALGEQGRSVRCANCGHGWFEAPSTLRTSAFSAPPPPVSPAETRKRPLPEGSNLPVVVVTYAAPVWLRFLCAALLPLVIILTPFAYRKSVLHNHPELAFLFEPFGIYYTDGLALADVALTKTPLDDNRFRVTLECAVINETTGVRTLPQASIALLDRAGRTLAGSPNLIATGRRISSGEHHPCHPFAFETSGKVERARIDLADPFDLALRSAP